jgi:hypothetical protein
MMHFLQSLIQALSDAGLGFIAIVVAVLGSLFIAARTLLGGGGNGA